MDCTLNGTSKATCAETATETMSNTASSSYPTAATETFSDSNGPLYQQVVITAGLSNLKSNVSSMTSRHMTSSRTATAHTNSGAMGSKPALIMGMGMLAISKVLHYI